MSLGLLVPLLFALLAQGATQEKPYEERVFVERVVVNVHVVDNLGRPIPGLTASDFRVAVDGKPVPLESAEWVPTAEVRAGNVFHRRSYGDGEAP